MFRSGRWRNEKNRIKVVFRLKFHATQASQFNTEGLVLSLVPGDNGKPTARSEEAVVEDGQCRWEIPVYETVKFLKDGKTGKVNQRIYHLIVSITGSTRAGLVGETSIDFADYAARFAELRRRTLIESDSTMSSSGSGFEPTTPEEVAKSLRHPPKKLYSVKKLFEEPRVSESEWSGSSDHGITTDDSTNDSSNDTMASNTARKFSEDGDEIEKLKSELAGLTRQTDLSEIDAVSK